MDFDDLDDKEEARSKRRVAFVDFWPGFDDDTDRFVSRRWFEENLVDVDVVHPLDDPNVVVFSVFGYEHRQHARRQRAKLVFYTGENLRPPVDEVPTCLSFDHIPRTPAASHMRLPIWVLDRELLQKRYKEVACGGSVLNNVGGPVGDKVAFLRSYRFNVAFENASHPGYCTEKVLHAFAAECVPIYWGDPAQAKRGPRADDELSLPDFNPAAMISAHDFESFEALIDHIAKVDRDPELLASYLRQPILSDHWYRRLRNWEAFCEELTEVILDSAESYRRAADEDDCGEF